LLSRCQQRTLGGVIDQGGSGDLNHHRLGAGEPLLLLHGIGSRWQVWAPVLHLLPGRDVVAVDLPGFGGSALQPAPAGGPAVGSVGAAADAVQMLAQRLGLDRPHVAGSSMGGAVALELGRRGVARSVIAFAPAGYWTTSGRVYAQTVVTAARGLGAAAGPLLLRLVRVPALRTAVAYPFYGRAAPAPPDLLDDVAALTGSAGFVPARRAFARLALAHAPAGDLATIPVTVAWGSADAVLPYRAQAARAAAALPLAAHVRLDGAPHLPFGWDPRRCAALILAPGTPA
jgi:pimeloyl-ACP methyl ester carboxylesterase